jgi:hypothetical protein
MSVAVVVVNVQQRQTQTTQHRRCPPPPTRMNDVKDDNDDAVGPVFMKFGGADEVFMKLGYGGGADESQLQLAAAVSFRCTIIMSYHIVLCCV